MYRIGKTAIHQHTCVPSPQYLLRSTLPCSLALPIPLYQDRQGKHIEIAVNLRIAQETKRTATKIRALQKKLHFAAANSVDDLGLGSKGQKITR